MLSTPFYGDQFSNSAAVNKRGMGETLFYEDLNYDDKVYDALRNLLQPRFVFYNLISIKYDNRPPRHRLINCSYAERAKIISTNFRNRPMTPIETSLWWIQYVLANGGELTKSHATNLSWLVYHSIDVMLLLGGVLISAVYGIIFLVKVRANRVRRCKIDSKNKRQ